MLVLQHITAITESLKTLVAEASSHQSAMDKLEAELSSIKQDYENLKREIADLGITNTDACSNYSQNKELLDKDDSVTNSGIKDGQREAIRSKDFKPNISDTV